VGVQRAVGGSRPLVAVANATKSKIEGSIKKTTLKARYKIAPTTVPALNVGLGFSPTKHRARAQNVAINNDLQKSF